MNWLLQTLVVNALLAAVLGAAALVVSRRGRRPALAHALWVLVLVKLLTPPLLQIPLDVEHVAAYQRDRGLFGPQATALIRHVAIPDQGVYTAYGDASASPAPVLEAAGVAGTESPATTTRANPAPATPLATIPATRPAASTATIIPNADADSASMGRVVTLALLLIWAGGAAAYAAMSGVRARRFAKLLRGARPPEPELADRCGALARRIGLRKCPPLRIVDAPLSPLVWSCGPATRIVLPAALMESLPPAERDALLLHELAHLRRKDHWVRIVELLANCLYWWHPIVWIARREIEQSEEECCDAWVVGEFPESPRRYAEALLAAIDYIAEHRVPLPPAASGLTDVPALERRLRQIMCDRVPKALSRAGRWSLGGLALLMPLQPVLLTVPASAATAVTASDLSRRSAIRLPESTTSTDSVRDSGERGDTASLTTSRGRITPPVVPHETLLASPIYLTAPSEARWATAESPGGRYRLVAEVGRRVFLEQPGRERRVDLSEHGIRVAAFLPDRDAFVTGSADGAVRLWEASTAQPLSWLGRHQTEVRSLDVSPDGRRIVSGSNDGSVFTWDAESGHQIVRTQAVGGPVACVRFARDGRTYAVAVGDWRGPGAPRIELYDAETGRTARTITLPAPAAALQFESPGRIVVADWNGLLTEWHVDSGWSLSVGSIPKEAVSAAGFSPNCDAFSDHRAGDPQRLDTSRGAWARLDSADGATGGSRDGVNTPPRGSQ